MLDRSQIFIGNNFDHLRRTQFTWKMWTYLLILYFAPFLLFSYLMLFLDFMCWNDYFITFYDFLHHQVTGRTRGSRGLTPQVQDVMTKKPKYNIILASTVYSTDRKRLIPHPIPLLHGISPTVDSYRYCKGRNYWVILNLGEWGDPVDHLS